MTARTIIFRTAILAAAAALVSACTSSLLPGAYTELPKLYVLTPKSTFATDLPVVKWQLTVDVPVAEAGLNNARIALRHNPISLEYFARANWIDTAPTMVQTLLVESFENTGKIVAVGRQSVSLRADYSLMTELREFQAEYDATSTPRVRVRLNAKLVKMPQRTIVGAMTIERVQPAAGSDLESIIGAFDVALGKALKRVVEWTLRTPERPRQRKRSRRRR